MPLEQCYVATRLVGHSLMSAGGWCRENVPAGPFDTVNMGQFIASMDLSAPHTSSLAMLKPSSVATEAVMDPS